jgi:MFS transporter, FSR family, fosmidomycin resistance protein
MNWIHRLLGTAECEPPARKQAMALQVLHFCNDGFQAAFLLFLPLRASARSLTALQIGVITALHFLTGVITATRCGALVRPRASLPVLLAGAVVYGACFTLAGRTESLPSLIAVYLLAGVGYGVFHPISFALVARLAPPNRASRAMGTFTAVGDVGRMVMSFALLTAAAGGDPSVVMQFAGLIACGVAAVTAVTTPRSSVATADCVDPGVPAPGRPAFRDVFRRNPGFARVCVLGFLDSVASSVLYVFLPAVLAERGGDDATVRACVTTFFAASLAGKVVVGWAADYLGALRTFVVFEVVNVLAIIALLAASGPTSLTVVAAALGIAAKGTLPVILSLTAAGLRKEDLSRGFGINQAILGVATTLSPLLLGWTGVRFGPAGAFTAAATICAAAALVGIAFLPRPSIAKARKCPAAALR